MTMESLTHIRTGSVVHVISEAQLQQSCSVCSIELRGRAAAAVVGLTNWVCLVHLPAALAELPSSPVRTYSLSARTARRTTYKHVTLGPLNDNWTMAEALGAAFRTVDSSWQLLDVTETPRSTAVATFWREER